MSEFEIYEIGGGCPLQAEGKVGNHEFYFRLRFGAWTLSIGDSVHKAIMGDVIASGSYGDDLTGTMPESEARELIEKHCKAYLSESEE